MGDLNLSRVIWKNVFSNWFYILLTVIYAGIFYFISVFLNGYTGLLHFYKVYGGEGVFSLLTLYCLNNWKTGWFNFALLIIMSILVGMLIILLSYRDSMVSLSKDVSIHVYTLISVLFAFISNFAMGWTRSTLSLISIVLLLLSIMKTTQSFFKADAPAKYMKNTKKHERRFKRNE